jgi:iron complex outermembrane receptor protein
MATGSNRFSSRAFARRAGVPIGRAPLALAVAGGVLAGIGLVSPVAAQETPRGTAALLEEVLVTARKREEGMQDVPVALSAFGSEQLDSMKVRALSDLTVGLPNVSLDDAGTAKGYANFSVRGLGINSSILSIDPTVGIFVDGVYMGIPAGMVFDVFDLERIEVLRGPQGTLFGRNVTGGAVLMTTRKPGDRLEGTVRAAVDRGSKGGLNKYLMGTVGGPLTDTLAAKFTAYLNDDDGWFENQFDGEDFGAVEQKMFRTVGVWRPFEATEVILRWEHGKNESDGPAGQAHTNGSGVPGAFANFDRNTHDFSVNERGFYDTRTDFVTLEINQGVGTNGTITNIAGWRRYEADSLGDIDSQPVWLFHSESWSETEQFSNELRYNGVFDERWNVTTGLYYFQNDIDYAERRSLAGLPLPSASKPGGIPVVIFDGGGLYNVKSWAVFAAVDYDMTDALTLNAGLRYTYEEKKAKIASLNRNRTQWPATNPSVVNSNTCNLVSRRPGERTCALDFVDDDSWTDLSPKLGLTYNVSDKTKIYGHWTRSFRSGGYNLRNTSDNPADVPGPFDEEQVTNYEIGFKSDFARGRLNGAIFYNEIDDMQRELNKPGPIGVVQLVRNTADASILGVEVDGVVALVDKLLLNFSVGWIDAEYDKVKSDLNGDGLINSADKSLDLPRAPEWTYSVGLNHDLPIGDAGYLNSRISYAYRDGAAYTDDNRGYLLSQKIVDLGIDYHTNDERWVVGIYGKNLLDEVNHGGDTQLPNAIAGVPTGGTFAPLSKGRIYGAQVTYNFF